MLDVIKIFIASMMFMISIFGFGIIIFNDGRNKNILYNLLMLFISSIIASIIFTYFDGTIKTIMLCVIFILIFRYVFYLNYDKAIFTSIIYCIITIIPDLLTLASTLYIFGISKEYYYSYLAGGIICNLSVSILMIILTYILRKPLKKLVNYNISTNKKIVLISILTIIFISIFFYKFAIAYELNKSVIAYLVAMFAFIILLFSLFKEKLDNEIVLKKYDELLDIMKNYESDIEEQRTLIHETKNELMTIKCKINDKEKESTIVEYIDSILGDKVSSNMSKYSKFKYLPSNGLKGFFYYKFIEAEQKGINVSINISKKIENSFLKNLDTKHFKELVRVIGVYLDNAIEASLKSKDKKLGIEVYLINNCAKIIISNTFESDINFDKVGKERYSTKGKNRGHGLLLVKKILHENDLFEAQNTITDKLYIQELKVKEPSE